MSTPIPSLGYGPYTVNRVTTAGSYVNGLWVPSADPVTVLTPICSVQPFGMKDTQLLPEAYRTRQAFRVYSETELRAIDVVGQKNCDVILIKGLEYDILSVDDWTHVKFMPHFKHIAVRREDSAL